MMAVQAEIIENPRLDSENESEYRKRYKLMTELGSRDRACADEGPDCRGLGCESGRAGLDYAAGQAV